MILINSPGAKLGMLDELRLGSADGAVDGMLLETKLQHRRCDRG